MADAQAAPKVLFLDSMIYMHYKPIEDIDWLRKRTAERGPGLAGRAKSLVIKLPERRRKLWHLMIGIEPARLRQQPQPRRPQPLRLRTDHRARASERGAIGADPDHRHPLRPVALDLALEPPRARDELVRRQLGGRRGGAGHEIRDPIAPLEQRALFPRRENAIGETGSVQHGPKPVARPREMVTDSTRIETGIDAAEQDPQPLPNHISHRAARSREHL